MGAKVTFNELTRTIEIDEAPDANGDVNIDVKVDLYSDGKEDWVSTESLRKVIYPLSAVGGNSLPGGRYLGATFFLRSDWKIAPYEADHRLLVDGNLYSEDGEDPFLDTAGAYTVRVVQQVSSLVDAITADVGSIAADVADAVWDEPLTAGTHDVSESGGKRLRELSDLDFSDEIWTSGYGAEVREQLEYVKDVESGRWKMENNQMIFYKADNMTEVVRFNLYDKNQLPAMENVYERERDNSSDDDWKYPRLLQLNIGSIQSGAITDLQLDDSNRLELNETTGNPGFNYVFFFQATPDIDLKVDINGYYAGNPAHNVKISILNATTYEWEDLTLDAQDFPSGGSDQDYSFNLPSPRADYRTTNGVIMLKIQHESNGSVGHKLWLDKMELNAQ